MTYAIMIKITDQIKDLFKHFYRYSASIFSYSSPFGESRIDIRLENTLSLSGPSAPIAKKGH